MTRALGSGIFPGVTLTVDTGMNTGWALWRYSPSINSRVFFDTWGTIKAKGKDTEERLGSLFYQFKNILCSYLPHYVYLEGQEMWSGNVTSVASAGSGSLFKLSYITGMYFGEVCEAGARPIIVNPTQWKGQLTKNATDLRIQRAFINFPKVREQLEKESEHARDAIGIGLALTGVL